MAYIVYGGMMTEVYNIANNLPGHSHAGTPSYIAYSHGCRHSDCLTEFNLYKLRLAARKIDGDYRDLRWRENQILAAAAQVGDQHRTAASEAPETATQPATPAITSTAMSVESGAAETPPSEAAPEPADEDSGDLDKVRKYLEVFCGIPGTKGKLNAAMLGVMPGVLRMAPDRCQAALDELEKSGLLAGDGTDLYLLPA